MNETDYETMDWEAEAKRIVAAFGIPVEFTRRDEESFDFRFTALSNYRILPEAEICLEAQYRSDGVRFFHVSHSLRNGGPGYSHLILNPDGTCGRFDTSSRALTNLIVQGISHLGLMTDEIALEMKASFTSNEELETIIANRPDIEFEPIDWEAEAARFVMAFDVEGDCKFVLATGQGTPYYYLCGSGAETDEFVLLSNGEYMSFILYPDAYYFFIGDKERGRKCAFVGLHRDGTILRNISTDPLNIVAEGVFNLGLYTPEVERAFKGVYFQSRRPAWETEHKARLAGERKNPIYDSMDWEAEAKRIVAAFEVVEPCRFNRHAGTARCEPTERIKTGYSSKLLLKSGMHAYVTYRRPNRSFSITHEGSRCGGSVVWDGSHIKWNIPRRRKPCPTYIANALAKSLFFLDLLTPEIEEAIGAAITAHERLEWTLEYEARNDL